MPEVARVWVAGAILSLILTMLLERILHFSVVTVVLLGLSLIAVLLSHRGRSSIKLSVEILLICGLAAELVVLVLAPPSGSLAIGPHEIRVYSVAVRLFCLALAVSFLLPALERWRFPLLLFAHCLIGAWVLHASRQVEDVLIFQQYASEAMARGANPYTLTFPDIYGTNSRYLYGNGLVADGRLLFGFPYPPASLLLILPGHLLGDVRFSHLAAITLAAVVIYKIASDRAGRLAACVFLFTPWVFHLEEIGWTEPFLVLMFALTILCHLRGSKATPLAFGLFLGLKQYAVLAIPLALQLIGLRGVAVAVAVAAAITLPFALWDWNAFLHSAVWLQFRQPWREDALSFAILLNRIGMPRLPWLGFAAAGVALAGVMLRRNTSSIAVGAAAFARDVALVLLAFFAFSKQAFYNYYFLVFGLLCCALAASGPTTLCRDTHRAKDIA